MDREEPETRQTAAVTSPEADDSREKAAATEEPVSPGAFQTLRALLEKTRRNQQGAPSRRELSRDKSKSFLLLAGATIALLLIFLGVFSSPKTRAPLPGETARGAPRRSAVFAISLDRIWLGKLPSGGIILVRGTRTTL